MSNSEPLELEKCLKLVLSADRVTGSLRLEPGYDPDSLNHDHLMLFLDSKAINRWTIQSEGIDELIELSRQTPDETHTVRVCVGQTPEPGVDGHFKFVDSVQNRVDQVKHREAMLKHKLKPQTRATNTSDQDSEEYSAKTDINDHVDFYSQSAYVIVHKGDKLGHRIPPTSGTDGQDIFGKILAVRPGRATDIHFDKTVQIDESGLVTAGESGRLIVENDSVSVENTLKVNSPVSFFTGNIDFPGDVIIAKGVKDRFEVKATGNISIRELVQACTIKCRGNLKLDVGIAGRDTAKIHIGGDLSARYIEACSGVISGNTNIVGEITNCTIRFEGDLISTTCAVRGGELTIAGKVDIATLGSENGTRTIIHAGSLTELDNLLRSTLEIGPLLANATSRINTRIDSAQGLDVKDDHVQSILETLKIQRSVSCSNLSRLADAADRILELAEQRTQTHFMVRKEIHAGTVITFKGWRVEFEQRVSGPILITVDHAGHPVATAPGETKPGPMARFARVIEDSSALRIELARARIEEMRRQTTPNPPETTAA